MKKLKANKKFLLAIVVVGGLAAGVLAFLGTGSIWIALLACLGGLATMRIWSISERQGISKQRLESLMQTSQQLTEAVGVLSLEIADLNEHVQVSSSDN